MDYNKLQKYAVKHNINYKSQNGKPITYNKLKNRVYQFKSKKQSKINNYEPRKRYIGDIQNISHTPFCQTSEYNEIDVLTEEPSDHRI